MSEQKLKTDNLTPERQRAVGAGGECGEESRANFRNNLERAIDAGAKAVKSGIKVSNKTNQPSKNHGET